MNQLKSCLTIILDFIFPRTCYICGLTDGYICKDCRKLLAINYIQRCHICGKETRLGFVHEECKESSYLDGLMYVVLYDGKIKKLIKDVKYHFYYAVLSEISEVMADYIKKYKFKNIIFTDVPLHWRRKNYRGFNQSELLAKQIAEQSDGKYEELLERNSNTKPQASLGKEKRMENLKGVFEMAGKFNLNDRTIIIVDDVFTTGSTLNECAKVLKHFGAQKVYGFCFAKSRE